MSPEKLLKTTLKIQFSTTSRCRTNNIERGMCGSRSEHGGGTPSSTVTTLMAQNTDQNDAGKGERNRSSCSSLVGM